MSIRYNDVILKSSYELRKIYTRLMSEASCIRKSPFEKDNDRSDGLEKVAAESFRLATELETYLEV